MKLDKELIRAQELLLEEYRVAINHRDAVLGLKDEQIEYLNNHIIELNKIIDQYKALLEAPIILQ
jgi:hypothetical protein